MILVEVIEPVIQIDGRSEIIWDLKLQLTDIRFHVGTGTEAHYRFVSPPRRSRSIGAWFEECRYLVIGNRAKGFSRSILNAICIVDAYRFDLCWSNQNPSAHPVNHFFLVTGQDKLSHTWALAHNRSPPSGANMMPTVKNKGKTVFGVRIGLFLQKLIHPFHQHPLRCDSSKPHPLISAENVWKKEKSFNSLPGL